MIEFHQQRIYYHISEPDIHNHNPAESYHYGSDAEMVPDYDKEKGSKATMGLWCKLGIRGNVSYSLFSKQFQWRDSPDKCDW